MLTDVASVTTDADGRLRPGCGDGRSRASGLFIWGRGAPLALRVLANPEAESSFCSPDRSIVDCLRSTRFFSIFRPYGSLQRSRDQARGCTSRSVSSTRVTRFGITLFNPGLSERLQRRSRGSTRRGTRGARISDTLELAKKEWNTWPVTHSRLEVRIRIRPVTGY